jgi:hypothetical protein
MRKHSVPKSEPGRFAGYCTHERHKRSYASRAQAKRALRRKQAPGGTVLSEYRCPTCGDWHLTSQS